MAGYRCIALVRPTKIKRGRGTRRQTTKNSWITAQGNQPSESLLVLGRGQCELDFDAADRNARIGLEIEAAGVVALLKTFKYSVKMLKLVLKFNLNQGGHKSPRWDLHRLRLQWRATSRRTGWWCRWWTFQAEWDTRTADPPGNSGRLDQGSCW